MVGRPLLSSGPAQNTGALQSEARHATCSMFRRAHSSAWIATMVAVLLATSPAGAERQERFRSGVALLELNVGVLDAEGQPVPDLRAQDFDVRVGGRERKVLLARYRATTGDARESIGQAYGPSVPFATNTAGQRGQVVVLAIDLETLKAGHEQVMLRTAARLIEAAGPNDAFGLLPIPGKSVDLTRDRAAILRALGLVRGTSARSFRRFSISVDEAVAFEQHHRRVIEDVVERECPQFLLGCPAELRDDAAELLRNARRHIQTFLTSVARVAARFQAIDAPKTFVIMSGGLPFEQESLTYFQEVKRQIVAAGIAVYAVQLHTPETDASNRRPGGVDFYAASDLDKGLANVASMTGGRFLSGVGTAAGAFDRITAAVMHGYVLGVELDAADSAGKPLDVRVEVRRPNMAVTAPLQATPRQPAARPAVQLAQVLAAPVPASALPLTAAAYVVRGSESGTLKVIIFGEIDVAGEMAPQFAVQVLSGERPVHETNGTAAAGPAGAQVLTAAQIAPGSYVIKLGAAQASRAGTLELPLSVQLRTLGALRISDLITGSDAAGFRPAITLRGGERAAALVEAYGEATELTALTATAAIRRRGSDSVLKQSEASIARTGEPDRCVILGALDTRGLEPGVYVLSMSMRSGAAETTVSGYLRIAAPE